MIRSLTLILCSLMTIAGGAQPADELLRFANGDLLHGRLAGFGEDGCLLWQRSDLDQVARFQTSNLRHAVLQPDPLSADLAAISLIVLTNGDELPGRITAIDRSKVALDSPSLGQLTIPLDKVSRISPQPTGGKVRYYGPYSMKGWEISQPNLKTVDPATLQADPKTAPTPAEVEDIQAGQEEQPDNNKQGSWKHNGAAWYWLNGELGTGLIRRNCLPENSIVRFDLEWKSNLSLLIGLNADFSKLPDAQKAGSDQQFSPGDSGSYPRAMGNAQVIQIHSSYLIVSRSVAGPDGDSTQRLQTTSSRQRLTENSKARFELRSNAAQGSVMCFINDRYVTQWTERQLAGNPDKPLPALGSGLAFYPMTNGSRIKLSNLLITEWNGMPDSARSMQTKDHDVMLMTNGTDRYSGKLASLDANGRLTFNGRHGVIQVPLTDVAEIQMAGQNTQRATDEADKRLTAQLSPMGSVSGTPVSGDTESLMLQHEILGPLRLSTQSTILLEFNPTQSTHEDWAIDF